MKFKRLARYLIWNKFCRQKVNLLRRLKLLSIKYRKHLKYWLPILQALSSTLVIAKTLGFL